MLIGLVGHIAAGKTTIADWLMNDYTIEYNDETYSFSKCSFADQLRDMLAICGIKKTRETMQGFGKALRDWRPNFWVDQLREEMDLHPWPFEVIDDVRYVNEAQFVLDRGGFLIGLYIWPPMMFERVKARMAKRDIDIDWYEFEKQLRHQSETDVEKCLNMCAMKIDGHQPIDQVQDAVKAFIEYERGKQCDNNEEPKPANNKTTKETWREGCH